MDKEIQEYINQADSLYKAFGQEFRRFEHLLPENFISEEFVEQIEGLSIEAAELALKDLDDLRVRYLGDKSEIKRLNKVLGSVPSEYKSVLGKHFSTIRGAMELTYKLAKGQFEKHIRNSKVGRETIDVTLPGTRPREGHLHLLTILRQKIEDIFVSLGYSIEDDREIETDYYNFDALNIPEGHPARESQDTFYTTNGFALRSQTSTVQIRAMERRGVPIRIIAPGRVFRRDTPDLTHTPMFHQIEGLCVDKNITMAHLKGTVGEWLRRLFNKETRIRLRPSYFPFTEPSAEFDFSCFKCGGTGNFETTRCRPCKGSGWIELGGSGMVHPNVLRACNVNPQVYSGFAFGFGLERMCSLMYSLDDIRLMFENDVRFLEQFR